jgi:hypothetical protein
MRNAVLQLPTARNSSEQRQVLRAAIRQLERADLYLVAVEYMELNDREAQRSLDRLRSDLESLRRYIAELRSGIRQ